MSKSDPFSGPSEREFGDIVNGRYYFPDPDTGRPRQFTRVTTFCKSVSDTYLLSLWQQRMAVKGITMRPDLLARAASLDVSAGRNELNKVVESAKEAAGSADRANLGSALHSFTESHDRGEDPHVPPPWDDDLAAYVALCEKESLKPIPDFIERTVYNRTFDLVGTLDRAIIHGTELHGVDQQPLRRILDLKTGKSLDWGWGEIAVQLYLYASADLVWNKETEEWEDLPPMDLDTSLVIHLPVGTKTATLYELDLSVGEEGAHLCKRVRSWRNSRGMATPVASVEL